MLQEHHEIFEPLTKRDAVDTIDIDGNHVGVISMIISYDSKYLVALCTNDDESFNVIGYCLSSADREVAFNNHYSGEYMKVNIIE